MVQQDTIKLLRECDAGIKMGITSIDEMSEYVHDFRLKEKLMKYKEDHDILEKEISVLLQEYHDDGKEPNPIAKSMSWMKINVKLKMDESDQTIADLMTDGCDMGIKSLSKYLNQYKAADEKSQNIAKRVIHLEEKLRKDMRDYL